MVRKDRKKQNNNICIYKYKNRHIYIIHSLNKRMPHNNEEINQEQLFALLTSISKFIDIKIRIYALGGTALTILNIKKSTLDIDINIQSEKEYNYLINIFESIGFEKLGGLKWSSQEGLVFDVFHSGYIFGTDLLQDYTEKSTHIKSFNKIDLLTLSLEDIIITKLARGDLRDFEDIKSIFKKENILIEELVQRYKKTMETSAVPNAKQKLLDLIHIKCKEWNIPVESKIINEVEKWE